jgi:hypothetical protein
LTLINYFDGFMGIQPVFSKTTSAPIAPIRINARRLAQQLGGIEIIARKKVALLK